jgi:hypothetical protein
MSKLGPKIRFQKGQTLVSANKNIVYKNAKKPKSELKYNELFFSKICDDFFPKKTGKMQHKIIYFFHICTKFCTQDIKAVVCLQVTSIEDVICVQ